MHISVPEQCVVRVKLHIRVINIRPIIYLVLHALSLFVTLSESHWVNQWYEIKVHCLITAGDSGPDSTTLKLVDLLLKHFQSILKNVTQVTVWWPVDGDID